MAKELSEQPSAKVEKTGRGRPRKTEAEWHVSLAKTQTFAREVREAWPRVTHKRVSVEVLCEALENEGEVCGVGTWRKYEAGCCVMSADKMFNIASIAFGKGARGIAVRAAMLSRHGCSSMDDVLDVDQGAVGAISSAMYSWIGWVAPMEMTVDDFSERFDRIVKLAKYAAWEKYLDQQSEREIADDRACDESGYYDDPVAYDERLIAAHEHEMKKYHMVQDIEFTGITYAVENSSRKHSGNKK